VRRANTRRSEPIPRRGCVITRKEREQPTNTADRPAGRPSRRIAIAGEVDHQTRQVGTLSGLPGRLELRGGQKCSACRSGPKWVNSKGGVNGHECSCSRPMMLAMGPAPSARPGSRREQGRPGLVPRSPHRPPVEQRRYSTQERVPVIASKRGNPGPTRVPMSFPRRPRRGLHRGHAQQYCPASDGQTDSTSLGSSCASRRPSCDEFSKEGPTSSSVKLGHASRL